MRLVANLRLELELRLEMMVVVEDIIFVGGAFLNFGVTLGSTT